MKYFDVKSTSPLSLNSLNENKIIVNKVEVIEGEVFDLVSSSIKVSTKLPTGETYEYFINPTAFYSNTRPGKSTDIAMNSVIHYCNYTSLAIVAAAGKKVSFRLFYSTVEGEQITVLLNKDLDGYTFSLTPSSKELILSKFAKARPIRSVFVGHDVKFNFEMIRGKVEQHIIPALTDLTQQQLTQLGGVTLIDAITKKEIETIF